MSGVDDIPLPPTVRKPIKIKRHCFGSPGTSQPEVNEGVKSKDGELVPLVTCDRERPSHRGSQETVDGERPSDNSALEVSDSNTSKTPWLKCTDAEDQSKIVDGFLKEFLVQKMAVIEKERHEKHIPRPGESDKRDQSSKKPACSEDGQIEATRKVQSSQDVGSRPFRDFLLEKMALIEAEREDISKAKKDSLEPKVEKSNSKNDRMEYSLESQAVLEKKKAGIEKECEIAERKAIEMARESSKPGIAEQSPSSSIHKTSKSHKKDKKREHKEKKKDKHKSRSHSREREKDKKSRHKDKHRESSGKGKHKDRHKSKDRHKERKEKSSRLIDSSASQSRDENTDCKSVSDVKLPKSKDGSMGQSETLGMEKTVESIKVPERQTKRKISADDKTVMVTIKGPSVQTSGDKLQYEEVSVANLEKEGVEQMVSLENTETSDNDLGGKICQNVTENGDKAETAETVQKEETPLEGNKKKVIGPIKLGIRISQTSADLIQSGRRLDLEAKTGNLEEGELEDTDGAVESTDQSSALTTEPSSSGSLSASDNDQPVSHVKHKKKKSKHKKSKKKHKSSKDQSGKRKSSASRSKTPKKRRHSRSRSRSRSRSYERRGSRSRSRSHDRLRQSRSRSWERHRAGRNATAGWRERRSRSRERLRDRWGSSWAPAGPSGLAWRNRRSRSRSRERRRTDEQDLRLKIDKAKLREIAIANAYANMQTGQGPPLILKADEIASIKAGGKSVEELTNFCKKISQKEGDLSSSSESEGQVKGSDDDADGPFIHHPFKVRAPQPNIVMNIRNAKQLPVQTPAEKMAQSSTLRLQFPVSSGSHHRDKEDEWVPVEKPTQPVVTAPPVAPPVVPAAPPTSTPAVEQPTAPEKPGVFPEPPEHPINIGAIVSERLSAMRKLQDNPNDVVAIGTMYKAQQQMNQWAASKQLPGQFTGSTGAQLLSQEQLSGLDRHNQAWIKKDQFTRAAPVKSGIGMYLLQKMGWKQGEGLGKNKEGQKEPLLLDFKTDRKGLTSSGESVRKNPTPPAVKDLAGKHPVSALVELCTKKRWGSPEFVLVHESGPDHKKNFLYKVLINKNEYQASVASTNKKHAKAQAATVCLQELGLVPRTPAISTTINPDTA